MLYADAQKALVCAGLAGLTGLRATFARLAAERLGLPVEAQPVLQHISVKAPPCHECSDPRSFSLSMRSVHKLCVNGAHLVSLDSRFAAHCVSWIVLGCRCRARWFWPRTFATFPFKPCTRRQHDLWNSVPLFPALLFCCTQ